MNKKEILEVINYHDQIATLKEHALDIGIRYAKKYRGTHIPRNEFDFENPSEHGDVFVTLENVHIQWNEYSCGESDYYSIEFPTSYLWEDWEQIEDDKLAKAKADREARRVAAKIARTNLEKRKAKKIEEREKKEYARLSKKYGK